MVRLVTGEYLESPAECRELAGSQVGCTVVTQFAEYLLFLAGILAGEPGKRISDNVAVMQPGDGRIAAHIEPQSVNQLYVVGA